MPRSYNSEKRKQLENELRQRIVEATAALHAEKGVNSTTYKDIAKRADVAIPTVYKKFPDLNSLFYACTRHAAALAPIQSEEMFAVATSLRQRVGVLVHTRCKVHAYFDPWLKWGGERMIPEVISLLMEDRAQTKKLILTAFAPAYGKGKIPKEVLTMSLLLLNYHTWASLQTEGEATQRQIEAYITNSICKLIEK
jgi:AcrR family transcriptional regulator